MTKNNSTRQSRWRFSKSGLALLAFAAIAAFFLVTEHRVHLQGALPVIILLLACVLMHRFMHGGHGGGHGGGDSHGDKP